MATAFQELITRLTLDSKNFKEGGEQVMRVTKQVKDGIEEMSLKSKEAIMGGFEKLRIGEVIAPLAALATAGGIVELGRHAVETSKDFDILQRRILGVVHSAERAKKVMEFNEGQSSLFGMFKPEELDDISTVLEALNLKTETFLPTVEKLALVMGGGASEMREFAEALGLIAQGESGRALRVLERAGISVKDLQRNGVVFNSPKQIASSPQATIKGINAAVDQKYGGELKQFMDSDIAQTQRFENAIDQAYRKAGDSIRGFFLPYVVAAGKAISELTENGQVERITNGFLKLFGMNTNNLEDGIKRIGNVLEAIPDKIAKIKSYWDNFSGYFLATVKVMFAAWMGMWAAQAIGSIVTSIQKVAAALKGLTIIEGIQFSIMLGIEALKKNVVGVVAALAVAGLALYGVNRAMQGLDQFGKVDSVDPKATKAKKTATEDTVANNVLSPDTQYLQQIAVNTKQTAVDLRRYALGGGDLGRIGVTPVQMSQLRMGGHSQAMHRVAAALQDLIGEYMTHHTAAMVRQGVNPNWR